VNSTEVLRGQVVTQGRLISDGVVAIDGDHIAWVGPAATWPAQLPAHKGIILPGLVDLHCHGGAGFGFPEADEQGSRAAARHHREFGTTSLLGSLVSAPPTVLVERIEVLSSLVDNGELAGIHLEGPFLSVTRCGAQDPAHIIDGDVDVLARLLETGRGTIRSMTLAPETAQFTKLCALFQEYGVVPSLGHTNASSSVTRQAILDVAGPIGATHLFNGMAPMHHREPGAVAACLAAAGRGDMVVELIADGVHLADDTVAMAFDLVGPGQIALVTDAMAAAGMPDGQYSLGSMDVSVVDAVARLAGDGAIAGGTTRLVDVVRRVVKHAGVDLVSAVTAASATPARLLGLGDRLGDVKVGYRADLLLVDEDISPTGVMKRGVRP
jgi:N-acetylglucosamine-6-phosphate deacetylase